MPQQSLDLAEPF